MELHNFSTTQKLIILLLDNLLIVIRTTTIKRVDGTEYLLNTREIGDFGHSFGEVPTGDAWKIRNRIMSAWSREGYPTWEQYVI